MARTARLLLIVGLAALVYAPVLEAPFVYEDGMSVTGAALVIGPAEHTGRWMPSRQLSTWSFALTPTPRLAHAGNVAVHLVNGLLVAAVGSALVSPLAGALAAAAFLWLPITTQAASYVSARPDLLVTFWTLLAVWLCLELRPWRWVGVGLCVCAAGMSKEIGLIAVPLVVVTRLLWRPSPTQGAMAWMAALVAVPGVWLWQARELLAVWQEAPLEGWADFLIVQNAALWHLLSPWTWVGGLSIAHDVRAIGITAQASAVMLTGICAMVLVVTWRAWPVVAWTMAWVGLSVLPRFLFPLSEYLSEHHLYLGMAALSLGLGAALASWLTVPERTLDGACAA